MCMKRSLHCRIMRCFKLAGEAALRILFTPHIAGVTRQSAEFLFRSAWRMLNSALLKNEAPQNCV